MDGLEDAESSQGPGVSSLLRGSQASPDLVPDLVPVYMVTVGTRWYILGRTAAQPYQLVPTSTNEHKHYYDSNFLGGTTINGRPVCNTGGSTCVFPHGDERAGVFERAGVCARRAFQTRNVPVTKGT